MSHSSKDAEAFGYDRAYALINSTPNRRQILKYVPHMPVSPAVFDIKNPVHVCTAAYMGFPMMPYNEQILKASVGPNGQYTRTVKDRVDETQKKIEAINRDVFYMGFQLAYDPKTPTDVATLELLRPMLGDFVDRLPLFDRDMAYMSAGRAARLHHFALEYNQPNVGAIHSYLHALDELARSWGLGSFANLNVPTKYIDHVATVHAGNSDMIEAIEDMQSKREQLKTESPYIIDLFVESHANRNLPYLVDVVNDELLIQIRHKSHVVSEYLKSKYIANDGSGILQAIMDQPVWREA